MSSGGGAQRGISLHTQMLIGFVAGIGFGLLGNFLFPDSSILGAVIRYVADPIGQIFLRLLFMLVVPLVFSALVLGVVEIGDPKALGRVGGKTLLYIALVTTIAVAIGLVVVNWIQPGRGIPAEVAAVLLEQSSARVSEIAQKKDAFSGIDLLLNIVPKNPLASAVNGDLIGVLFFALMVGIAASTLKGQSNEAFVGAVRGLYDICLALIGWIIRLAPFAVAALLFAITARLGLEILLQLARYVGTVLLALGLHFFVVFPLLVRWMGRMPVRRFFKAAEPAILTSFSTSSSSATLPTTLEVAEHRLGVPPRVGRFVCTLGATANMNGTALFEGVTVLFLAQFFGVDLSLWQQLTLVLLCVLGGIGAAGVPGGSLPVIAMILAMFGIPPEGIGLILGVDRLLDMCRTTVNVTGDLVGAVVVGRGEASGQLR